MNRLRDLERELERRMSESRKKDDYIARLEHRLDERDASVRHLRNEIDKFRQVVRPLTHHIMAIQMSADDLVVYGNGGGGGCCNGDHHHGHGPGSSFKGRPTRQAISAEPLRTTDPLPIVKVPKSSKWVTELDWDISMPDTLENVALTSQQLLMPPRTELYYNKANSFFFLNKFNCYVIKEVVSSLSIESNDKLSSHS